jgi:Flp pilus assembly protein TadD
VARGHRRSRELPGGSAAVARRLPPLLAIGAAALAVRAWHIAQIARAPFFGLRLGDAASYDAWARTIVGGDWFGHTVFYQAPLYPYFLALVYGTIGDSVAVVRSAQAVLGALACVLLADAGWRLFSRRAGIAAGLLLAVYPPAVFLDTIVQKSALDNLFLCLVLWLIAVGSGRMRPSLALALGGALGLLMLTRENAGILTLPLAAWLAVGGLPGTAERAVRPNAQENRGAPDRRAGGRPRKGPDGAGTPGRGRPGTLVLTFAVGVALVVLPVTLRNAVVGGELAITTAQFGPNFYIGNNPAADGLYKPLAPWRGNARFEQQDATDIAERALGRTLTPGEVSAYFRDRALAFVRAEPGRWLRLLGRKAMLTINAVEVSDTEDQYTYARWSWPLKLAALWNFAMLAPLAAAGLWMTRADWRRLWVLYGIVALYAATLVFFYVFGRYRFPLVPPLMLFAGTSLVSLPSFVRQRPAFEVTACVAGCAIVATLCEVPLVAREKLEAVTRYNIGVALGRAGRTEDAIAEYRAAVALDPALPMAHGNLGLAFEDSGQLEAAAAQFRAALRRAPHYAGAHNNLGVVLAKLGKTDEAAREFREALRQDATDPEAHNNLGQMLELQGRLDAAAAEYQRAVGLAPDYLTPWRNLMRLRVRQNQVGPALDAARQSVRIAPQNPDLLNDFGLLLAQSGRLEDAAAQFERALALDPSNATIRRNLDRARAALSR